MGRPLLMVLNSSGAHLLSLKIIEAALPLILQRSMNDILKFR
jgi:hypothetical protein